MKRFFLLSLLAFALAACGQVIAQVTPREAIAQIAVNYARGMNEGNAALLTSLHSDDAVVYPPGMETLRGKDAIARAFAEIYAEGVPTTLNTKDIVIVIADSGDFGYIAVTFYLPDGLLRKHLMVVRGGGDSWLINDNMWNEAVDMGLVTRTRVEVDPRLPPIPPQCCVLIPGTVSGVTCEQDLELNDFFDFELISEECCDAFAPISNPAIRWHGTAELCVAN